MGVRMLRVDEEAYRDGDVRSPDCPILAQKSFCTIEHFPQWKCCYFRRVEGATPTDKTYHIICSYKD